jgi:hypothetical protein
MKLIILFNIHFLLNFLLKNNIVYCKKPEKYLRNNNRNSTIIHNKNFYHNVFSDLINDFRSLKNNISHYSNILNKKQFNINSNQLKNEEILFELKTAQKQMNFIYQKLSKDNHNFREFIDKDYSKMRFFQKKRKTEATKFYNSLSFVMLGLLSGGLVILLIVLCFQGNANNKFEYPMYEY